MSSSIHVHDEGALRHYRTEIPNTIVRGQRGKTLSLHAKWLYVYLKSVAGDGHECWQSTTTMADGSGLSRMSVSRAKQELATQQLIALLPGVRANRDATRIRIMDIWQENMQEFSTLCTTQIHQSTTQIHQQLLENTEEDLSGVSDRYTGVPDRYSGVPVVAPKKIPYKNKPKKRKKSLSKSLPLSEQETPFPDDFTLTPAMREWFHGHIDSHLVDIDRATEKWRNNMLKFDRRYIDWIATWRNAMYYAEEWLRDKEATRGAAPAQAVPAPHKAHLAF